MIKKILGITLAAIMAVCVGCKSIPTTETVESTSRAIGTAVALVMNQTSLSTTNRAVIIEISMAIDASVPQTNTSFEVAWMPIATDHVQKLVDKQKIDAREGEIILTAFKAGVKTLDYCADKKWKDFRKYQDLVEAATHGFFDGFLTYFKPANSMAAAATTDVFDTEAYYLMKALQKSK